MKVFGGGSGDPPTVTPPTEILPLVERSLVPTAVGVPAERARVVIVTGVVRVDEIAPEYPSATSATAKKDG